MPIVLDIPGLVEMAKTNPCPVVGKVICESHVCKVWEMVSAFILQNLCNGRAVRIPHLATITFKPKAIELSAKEVIVQKVPHIILASEIAVRHGLKVKIPPYNLDVPEVDLNMSFIACNTGIPRTTVERIVDEIIAAFNRAIMADPQVELWFPKIGRLVIQCNAVDVVFCSEFLNTQGYAEEFIQNKECPLR